MERSSQKTQPDRFISLIRLAIAKLKGNLLEEACEAFDRVAQFQPPDGDTLSKWDSDILFKWGTALAALGRNEEAIEKFQRADQLQPMNLKILKSWGAALRQLGRGEEAKKILKQAFSTSWRSILRAKTKSPNRKS